MKNDPLFRDLPDSFDQRCPAPHAPPPKVRAWDVALSAFIFLAMIAIGLMAIVPKFAEVYRQVKVPMPGMTLLLIRVSDAACAWPMLLALLMTAIPASVHLASPRCVSVARPLVPILAIAVLGWAVVALFLPLTGLLEGCGIARR